MTHSMMQVMDESCGGKNKNLNAVIFFCEHFCILCLWEVANGFDDLYTMEMRRTKRHT